MDGVGVGQGLKIEGVILTAIDKMPVAALQGKAVRKRIHAVDDVSYRSINNAVMKLEKIFLPLLLIIRIFDQFFRFCVCFQDRLSSLDSMI